MSPEPLTLSIDTNPASSNQASVRSILEHANTEFGYPRDARHFCGVLRNREGSIEGGINAQAYWGWLYVADLAIEAKRRHKGYGHILLSAAESWALECACHDAWLSTLSFQARGFYEREGYRVFAELPNFPERQVRFFLRKQLGQ
jgi:GNAT superfamily N-acetyltransferase